MCVCIDKRIYYAHMHTICVCKFMNNNIYFVYIVNTGGCIFYIMHFFLNCIISVQRRQSSNFTFFLLAHDTYDIL